MGNLKCFGNICVILRFMLIGYMQKLNFLQLFEELIIEISAFNKFPKNIKEYNIICDFDYYDLEDYARLKPEISRIESTKITFILSESWVNSIKRTVA